MKRLSIVFLFFLFICVPFFADDAKEVSIPLGLNFGMTEKEINDILVDYGFIEIDNESWYGRSFKCDGVEIPCYFVMVKYDDNDEVSTITFMLEKSALTNMYAYKYEKYYKENYKLPVWYTTFDTVDFTAMNFEYHVYKNDR